MNKEGVRTGVGWSAGPGQRGQREEGRQCCQAFDTAYWRRHRHRSARQKRLDLGHVLRDAVATIMPAAEAKGVRVQTVLDTEASGLAASSLDHGSRRDRHLRVVL